MYFAQVEHAIPVIQVDCDQTVLRLQLHALQFMYAVSCALRHACPWAITMERVAIDVLV